MNSTIFYQNSHNHHKGRISIKLGKKHRSCILGEHIAWSHLMFHAKHGSIHFKQLSSVFSKIITKNMVPKNQPCLPNGCKIYFLQCFSCVLRDIILGVFEKKKMSSFVHKTFYENIFPVFAAEWCAIVTICNTTIGKNI